MTNNDTGVYYDPALLDSPIDVNGFIDEYKEAFSGPPYHETYTDDQVHSIWEEHRQHGRIILARSYGKVIGLGCSVPLHRAPDDVQAFLGMCKEKGYLPNDFTPGTAWYMSELAVLEAYRNRGIAYELVRHRLFDVSHGRSAYYVMRTASEKSKSMHLYLNVGARTIPELHDISESDQVTGNGSESTTRIYLFGESSKALDFLTKRLDDDQERTA